MWRKNPRTLALALLLVNASFTFAQDVPQRFGEPLSGDIGVTFFRIQYTDAVNPMVQWCDSLFDRPETAQELELFDYQKDELQLLLKTRIEWSREERPKYENDKSKFDQLVMERIVEDAKKVLLPHQWTKLEQMAFADAKDQLGVSGTLSLKWFRERAGLSEDDVKRLKDRAEKEKAILEEKIAKAKKEAEENVLEELNAEQKAKIKEMFGDGSK